MNPIERFFSKVDISDGYDACWIWTAGKTSHGYGMFAPRHVNKCAHRVIYEWIVGPIPERYDIDHLCANRACVNPLHLEPVTHRENVRRAWARRREMAQAATA